MSLFQCSHCGCVENTALSHQGFTIRKHIYDWSSAKGQNKDTVKVSYGIFLSIETYRLCCVCGPVTYANGVEVKGAGVWHGQFSIEFLPKLQYVTNDQGNIEHVSGCSVDVCQYSNQEYSDSYDRYIAPVHIRK